MEKKSQMKVFTFAEKNQPIRVEVENNETWFVAKDVCKSLEVSWRGFETLQQIPEEWKGVRKLRTPHGYQEFIVINEAGLYKLAFRSNKPMADAFTNMVAGEVLPSIRKTGSYEIKRKGGLLSNELYTGLLCELRNWIHKDDKELVAIERGCTYRHVVEVLGGRKVSMPIMGMLVELGKERKSRGERVICPAEMIDYQLRLWNDNMITEGGKRLC